MNVYIARMDEKVLGVSGTLDGAMNMITTKLALGAPVWAEYMISARKVGSRRVWRLQQSVEALHAYDVVCWVVES